MALQQQSRHSDRVVQLLNDASLESSPVAKVAHLHAVQELLIHVAPDLLDNFVDEVLQFQTVNNNAIRQFVISFIEEACRVDSNQIANCLPTLLLLIDTTPNVAKRVVIAATVVYRMAFTAVVKYRGALSKLSNTALTHVWQPLLLLKQRITELLTTPGTPVPLVAQACKFVETVILLYSFRTKESQLKSGAKQSTQAGELSLDLVPLEHPFISLQSLREDGKALVGLIIGRLQPAKSGVKLSEFLGTLQVAAGSLSDIASLRPVFMGQVCMAMTAAALDPPSGLSEAQLPSFRKTLKTQLVNLLKHPASIDYHNNIADALSAVGAKEEDYIKWAVLTTAGSTSSGVKRSGDDGQASGSKRARIGDDTPSVEALSRLPLDIVVSAVLDSLRNAPDRGIVDHVHPLTFVADLAAATSESRDPRLRKKRAGERAQAVAITSATTPQTPHVHTTSSDFSTATPVVKIETVSQVASSATSVSPVNTLPLTKKLFSLEPAEMDVDEADEMAVETLRRMLGSVKEVERGGGAALRLLLVTRLVSHQRVFIGHHSDSLTTELCEYILSNISERIDLAIVWLNQELRLGRAEAATRAKNAEDDKMVTADLAGVLEGVDTRYEAVVEQLINGLYDRLASGDRLFTSFAADVPVVTSSIFEAAQRCCAEEDRVAVGLTTLRELALQRPPARATAMRLLLSHTVSPSEFARAPAISVCRKLYSTPDLSTTIESFGRANLRRLAPSDEAKSEASTAAELEDCTRLSLLLFYALCLHDHSLLSDVVAVYVTASTAEQRVMLRHLDTVVTRIGMGSEKLLQVIGAGVEGSESMVLRTLHVLTETQRPTPRLVEVVQGLFKNTGDARFLIPIISGLKKHEIISVLPRLIVLPREVVKNVVSRLLATGRQGAGAASPLSPSELMVALHGVTDSSSEDGAALLKEAVAALDICFEFRAVYKQEVLAVAMQQLVDQTPLPLMFMRTVLKALDVAPKLVGFVVTLLTRLIPKEVWAMERGIWNGFVLCCSHTLPHSYPVILQLPAIPLQRLLEARCFGEAKKELLVEHVRKGGEAMRAAVKSDVLKLLGLHTKKSKSGKSGGDVSNDTAPLHVDGES